MTHTNCGTSLNVAVFVVHRTGMCRQSPLVGQTQRISIEFAGRETNTEPLYSACAPIMRPTFTVVLGSASWAR